MSDNQHYC